MQNISTIQLRDKLADLRASTAIAIETETVPKMLKKDRDTKEPNPYIETGIVKIGTMAGLIGCSYSNSVNNQLGREDKELVFEAENRKWGTLMDNKNLVIHTPKGQEKAVYYLQILVKSAQKPIYTDGTNEIDVTELNGVLTKKVDPKTQKDLDKKIVLRDIKLGNIKVIRMLGETYNVCSPNELIEMEKTTLVKENKESIERVAELLKTV